MRRAPNSVASAASTGQIVLALSSAANLTRVASEMSYACRRCGERHRDRPMSHGTSEQLR